MKKYITLFGFMAFFFVGSQFISAQNSNERPEAIAKEQTHTIHKLVELTGEQQGKVFKVLVDAENNLSGLNETNQGIKVQNEAKAAIAKNTDMKLKAILTPEQYAIYSKNMNPKPKKAKK